MAVAVRSFKEYSMKRRIAALRLQAWYRMVLIRQTWAGHLQDFRRYSTIWKPLLDSLGRLANGPGSPSNAYIRADIKTHRELIKSRSITWESIKTQHNDMMRTNLDSDASTASYPIDETEKLDSAVLSALNLPDDNMNKENDTDIETDGSSAPNSAQTNKIVKLSSNLNTATNTCSRPPCDHIQLTKDVIRWLDRQDSKYRNFFVRRIYQLAMGERSRILKKNITGTRRTTIWETYLDQKSAQRILWTEYKYEHRQLPLQHSTENHERGIFVWYVAKHDNVPRLIKLIDNAESRSRRQLATGATSLFFDNNHTASKIANKIQEEDEDDNCGVLTWHEESHSILADPFASTPLKVHTMHRDELSNFTSSSSWKPPLRLTQEERSCVQRKGTVLLLGRSGTGYVLEN